jgi:DNA-binding IclR family transcriptional regulator
VNAPRHVVGRATAVLRTLAEAEPRGATTTEVAKRTDLARPTAHRLLESLASEGLVERDPATHRWVLGAELYLFGRSASTRFDVTDVAHPIVQQLAKLTGESAFFSARRADETVCLLREDGSFPIRSHVLYEGIRLPLGVGSAGLAILAHLPRREADAYLNRVDLSVEFGVGHVVPAIEERLAATRTRGWALNDGHIVEGSWGIGAAVFDSSGRPRWALSLTGIEQRFSGKGQAGYGRVLLEAAHNLSQRLTERGE